MSTGREFDENVVAGDRRHAVGLAEVPAKAWVRYGSKSGWGLAVRLEDVELLSGGQAMAGDAAPSEEHGPVVLTLVDGGPSGSPRVALEAQHVVEEQGAAKPLREQTRYEREVKPRIDRIGALVLLLGFAPVIAVVAVLIRIWLGPGILYRQVRVGQYGEPFTMLKFRTMRPDRRRNARGSGSADRRSGRDRRGNGSGTDRAGSVPTPSEAAERRRDERRQRPEGRRWTHKTPHDPRHTPFGRFLRRYSLDELPQLINVVRGELSLVGPRPELPEVVAAYEPWQHERHQVKPGLTGLWQVTERQDQSLMHLHVETDLRYIERLSMLTDLSILLRTPAVAFGGGRGA